MHFCASHRTGSILLPWFLALLIFSGCIPSASGQPRAVNTPASKQTGAALEATPQPQPALPEPAAAEPTPVQLSLWIAANLPAGLRKNLPLPEEITVTSAREQANLWLEIAADASPPVDPGKEPETTSWLYAVAAPFPTLVDELKLADLQQAWQGRSGGPFKGTPLLMTPETRTVLEAAWGPANPKGVREVGAAELLDTAWEEGSAWAILPFEAIEPRWKVLRLDGQSPLEPAFDPTGYPLAIPIRLAGTDAALRELPADLKMPGNYDPSKKTVLVMTGVTALSRHIAEVMEKKGVTYPARSIRPWLVKADLTHISNEVSFYQECPKPGPLRADMRFCSNPRYIHLLEAVGTDIVELTGNHNLDWGIQPYLDTLKMYQQRGWKTYGGGANLEEARQPLIIEHNGNKLVFLGCSPAGPEPVWATADKPGSAPCKMNDLVEQVRQLRAEGYLPIVTLQAVEADTYQPPIAQAAPDFRKLAKAGAVIVSGSQAHLPQTMTFVSNNFVHYGLGNLFFDQMTPPEARQQFIDRHIFYDGRYLGVELLTALLEESARPRPMTPKERASFLEEIFSLSDWSGQ